MNLWQQIYFHRTHRLTLCGMRGQRWFSSVTLPFLMREVSPSPRTCTVQYSTVQYTVQSPTPCTAAGPRAAPRDRRARRGGRRGPRERPYTCTGSVPPFWNREGDIRNENIFYCISQKYFVQQPKIFCISQVLLQAFIIGSTQLSRQSSSL